MTNPDKLMSPTTGFATVKRPSFTTGMMGSRPTT